MRNFNYRFVSDFKLSKNLLKQQRNFSLPKSCLQNNNIGTDYFKCNKPEIFRHLTSFLKSSQITYARNIIRCYYSYNRQSGASSMNPYEVLGVTKSSTEKEIKIAYFKQAKKYHPDMNPGDKNASANFQKVNIHITILNE